MTKQSFYEAAEKLQDVRLTATAIEQLPDFLRPSSIDESYALQELLNELLIDQLGQPVGYKIGCTTTVMQEYLKITHPCGGRIFSSTVQKKQGLFSASKLCRPGVECELAVQLLSDMPAGKTYTARECTEYVGTVFPTIELVDDRWINYQTVDVHCLIAENFFGAGCVIGDAVPAPAKEDFESLANIVGRLRVNDRLIGEGLGADILGHPYEALAWLANHQVQRGSALAAGDIISLGSVVKTHWLKVGDRVRIEFDGLGGCMLEMTK